MGNTDAISGVKPAEEFLKKLREHDRDAMTEFVKTELPRVYNFCFRLCRRQADAEDLAQDTFVRALRGLQNFRGASSLSTWLYRIAANTWKNRVRYESRRHASAHVPLNQEEDQKPLDITDGSPRPEHVSEMKEEIEALHKALSQMKEDEKIIIVLKDIEDRSYEDIATILDINIGTVKSRLSRARAELREIVQKNKKV